MSEWIPTSERLPELCTPVIGFAEAWVDEDFNTLGMRECFRNDDTWLSSAWNNSQDCWDAIEREEPEFWRPFPPVPLSPEKPPCIPETTKSDNATGVSSPTPSPSCEKCLVLQQQLQKKEEDTKRLNWLQKEFYLDEGYGQFRSQWAPSRSPTITNDDGTLSLRKAIDAALGNTTADVSARRQCSKCWRQAFETVELVDGQCPKCGLYDPEKPEPAVTAEKVQHCFNEEGDCEACGFNRVRCEPVQIRTVLQPSVTAAPAPMPERCAICEKPITPFDCYGVSANASHRYHWDCVKREAKTVWSDADSQDLVHVRVRARTRADHAPSIDGERL